MSSTTFGEFKNFNAGSEQSTVETGMLSIELVPQGGSLLAPAARRGRENRVEDSLIRYALRKESVDPVKSEAASGADGDPVSAEKEEPAATDTTSGMGPGRSSPPESTSGWGVLVAQVLAIALVASCITLLALKFSGLLKPAQMRVVTFDVLKYENAERAAAMKLMGQGGRGSVAPMLSYVSKRLRTAIRRAAGPDTLVVLSQAVVQGQTRDITDQVLKELGLPTNVPTAAPIRPAVIAPRTITPPIKGNSDSPLSRLVNSGAHTKPPSIVP
ncbi:MAG: hypothetical protein ACP5P4_12790 [Steroidobacteraceae bacterium]